MASNNSIDGEAPQRPTGPRLYHRKSRMGCLRCKARRVKASLAFYLQRCDEQRPSCSGCSRHLVECIYPEPNGSANARLSQRNLRSSGLVPPSQSDSPSAVSPTASSSAQESPADLSEIMMVDAVPGVVLQHPTASSNGYQAQPTPSNSSPGMDSLMDSASAVLPPLAPADDDLPESRERRITELSLLHHYILYQAKTFGRPLVPLEYLFATGKPTEFLWAVETIQMAFEDDCILYGMLAHSALSRWIVSVDEGDGQAEHYQGLQQRYFSMALREQRRSAGQLSGERTDHICIASMMLLSHAFALVQTVPVSPWEPPAEFMQIGRGVSQVMLVARGYHSTDAGHGDRMERFLNAPPNFDPDEIFAAENRAHLEWLLDAPAGTPPDRELQMKVTRSYYLRALAYVGWCERAVRGGRESDVLICRRLAAYPVWVPEVLSDFLAQRRPRALVALAYYFALWIPYEHLWMIRKTGARQVRAIYETLPPEWRGKLDPIITEYGL